MKKMQNNIILIIALFLIQLVYSQNGINMPIEPQQCSSYTPNPELDKFTGHWKWSSGNDSFEIIMKKEKIFHLSATDNSCLDIIIGFHQYIKNGVIVENSLQYQNTNFNDKLKSIFGVGVVPNQILWAGIDILSTGNNMKMELQYIDATHVKVLSIKNYQGVKIYLPGQVIPSGERVLPDNIILTKQ